MNEALMLRIVLLTLLLVLAGLTIGIGALVSATGYADAGAAVAAAGVAALFLVVLSAIATAPTRR